MQFSVLSLSAVVVEAALLEERAADSDLVQVTATAHCHATAPVSFGKVRERDGMAKNHCHLHQKMEECLGEDHSVAPQLAADHASWVFCTLETMFHPTGHVEQ